MWPSLVLFTMVVCSCGGGRDRHVLASRADSLTTSVQVFTVNLNRIDTAAIDSMILRKDTWISFIARNVRDTLSMGEAGSIQRFSEAGEKLLATLNNRRRLLDRANTLTVQLKSLAADLRSGSMDVSNARQFLENELEQALVFSVKAEQELRDYGSAVAQYRQHADAVADVVRDHNQGELPRLVAQRTE